MVSGVAAQFEEAFLGAIMGGSVITTNYVSLVTQNYISKSYDALQTSIERLSSGYRINSAKDDAAGMAIANRFKSQINGLTQAARNANDGISIAQTTEGAVNETNNSLQRIRELTIEALNGSNSPSDLQSIQAEISQRLAEIDRVGDQTQFNGLYVFKGGAALTIQVGYNDGETITIDLQTMNTKTLGIADFNVAGPKGATAAATAADYQKAFGGATTVAANTVALTAGDLAGRLGVAAGSVVPDGAALLDTKGTWFVRVVITPADATEVANLKSHGFNGVAGQAKDYFITLDPKTADITKVPANAAFTVDALNIPLNSLNTAATARPLQTLDLAIQSLSDLRGNLGATMSRMESTVTTLNDTVVNLQAARSRIQDADYAVEVSNMTRAQILQQAGTSALAQANQVPQLVLALLRS